MSVIQFLLHRHSQCVWAEIGKYASQHGVAAEARFYSWKLGQNISETTAFSIKKAYLQGVKEKRAANDSGDVRLFLVKKWGRQVLLRESLDVKVKHYLVRARQGVGNVSAWIVMTAARGILLPCSQSRLAEVRGDVCRNSAYELLWAMSYLCSFKRSWIRRYKGCHNPVLI